MPGILGTVGKALMSDAKASAYLQRGSANALRLGARAESMVAKSGSISKYAANLESTAIGLRQAQIGGRAVGGAAAFMGVSSLGSGRKSYYNPPRMQGMRSPQGSGRFA